MKAQDVIQEDQHTDIRTRDRELYQDLVQSFGEDFGKFPDYDHNGLWDMNIYVEDPVADKLQKAFPNGPDDLEFLMTGG